MKALPLISTADVRGYWPVERSRSAVTRWSIAMPKTRCSDLFRMNGDTVVLPNPPRLQQFRHSRALLREQLQFHTRHRGSAYAQA